jgi:hypothetical protein
MELRCASAGGPHAAGAIAVLTSRRCGERRLPAKRGLYYRHEQGGIQETKSLGVKKRRGFGHVTGYAIDYNFWLQCCLKIHKEFSEVNSWVSAEWSGKESSGVWRHSSSPAVLRRYTNQGRIQSDGKTGCSGGSGERESVSGGCGSRPARSAPAKHIGGNR